MGCLFKFWIISTVVPSIYHFFNIFYIFDFISKYNLKPLKQMLAFFLHHRLTFSKLTFIFIVVAFFIVVALVQGSKHNAFICVAQLLFALHAGNRGPIQFTKYLPSC